MYDEKTTMDRQCEISDWLKNTEDSQLVRKIHAELFPCKHDRVILASATEVSFTPDQEPFKEGVVEPSGFEEITVESLNLRWCPHCKTVQSIEFDGDSEGSRS